MYVQLKSIKQVTIDGNAVICHPGDWVNVGKQTALNWMAVGDAWVPTEKLVSALPGGAGIGIRGPMSEKQQIGTVAKSLPAVKAGLELPYRYTMLWHPGLRFPGHLLGAGFHLLERWQVVVPLWSYSRLANTAGEDHARGLAKEVLHDLRVPLYDTRLLFTKRTATTSRMMELWRDWLPRLKDERLAFLCAVYQSRPLICALPALDRRPR